MSSSGICPGLFLLKFLCNSQSGLVSRFNWEPTLWTGKHFSIVIPASGIVQDGSFMTVTLEYCMGNSFGGIFAFYGSFLFFYISSFFCQIQIVFLWLLSLHLHSCMLTDIFRYQNVVCRCYFLYSTMILFLFLKMQLWISYLVALFHTGYFLYLFLYWTIIYTVK